MPHKQELLYHRDSELHSHCILMLGCALTSHMQACVMQGQLLGVVRAELCGLLQALQRFQELRAACWRLK